MRFILAIVAICLAGMASASQIKIVSVGYDWDFVSAVGPTSLIELSTTEDQISWGTPYGKETVTGFEDEKSAFRFDQVSKGLTVEENTMFDVGVFTHLNNVIDCDEYLTEARLNLTLRVNIDGTEFDVLTSYNFGLIETANYAQPCADGGTNPLDASGTPKAGGPSASVNRYGCADRVTLIKNDAFSSGFTMGGKTYTFDLFGFDGETTMWTVEDMTNRSFLTARFTVLEDRTPEIPLPAGVWLMLAGLGALGAQKRFGRR